MIVEDGDCAVVTCDIDRYILHVVLAAFKDTSRILEGIQPAELTKIILSA